MQLRYGKFYHFMGASFSLYNLCHSIGQSFGLAATAVAGDWGKKVKATNFPFFFFSLNLELEPQFFWWECKLQQHWE